MLLSECRVHWGDCRCRVTLQGAPRIIFGEIKAEVFLSAAFTLESSGVLRGLCRDRGRGERLDGVLVFAANVVIAKSGAEDVCDVNRLVKSVHDNAI